MKITVQCVGCKKKQVLTAEQVKAAQELGVPMCSCGMPPIIVCTVCPICGKRLIEEKA